MATRRRLLAGAIRETLPDMRANDEKTLALALAFGSRPAAVFRLRGWERYALLAFALGSTIAAGLSLASPIGVSMGGEVSHLVEGIASLTALPAVIGVLVAIRRYDGETAGLPDSRARRLASRLTRRQGKPPVHSGPDE